MKTLPLDSKLKPKYLDTIEDYDKYFILRLKGDIDTAALERDREKMTALIKKHGIYNKSILCDFGKVTDSDTATIAAIIKRFAEFRKQKQGGHKMAFFNVHGELRYLFELARLDKLFTIRETQAEAEATLA